MLGRLRRAVPCRAGLLLLLAAQRIGKY